MVTLQTSPCVGDRRGVPSASPIVTVDGLKELIRIMVGELCAVAKVCDDLAWTPTVPLNVWVVKSDGAAGELSQPARATETTKQAANRDVALVILIPVPSVAR